MGRGLVVTNKYLIMARYKYEEEGYYFGHKPEIVVMPPVVINTDNTALGSDGRANDDSEVVNTPEERTCLGSDGNGLIYDSEQSVILKKRKLF